MKSIIILGSARSDGNTKKLITNILCIDPTIEVVDLNQYEIGYFDYEFSNKHDDFIPLCEKILNYDNLIFASPVYWYSMSAQLKTFFDRITDLMKIRKDLGRRLNGKLMMSISCGSGPELNEGFIMPFRESAEYLKMDYLGHLHGYISESHSSDHLKEEITDFLSKRNNHGKTV